MRNRDYPGTCCDRCRKQSGAYIMSMFNTQWICMDCKEAEQKRDDYQQAVDRDVAEYMQRVEAARGR
jgi:hypothetical protein